MKSVVVAFCCAVIILHMGILDSFGETYKKMTITAATANPPGSMQAITIDKFKEIVETESNNAITVKTFYGGSMGDEQANVKQVRANEIQLCQVACGNLTPFAPSAGVLYLPYMFPDINSAKKLFSDKEFMENLANRIAKESKTRPLSWLMSGYRVITNAKKPIKRMEDLRGLKIRVPPVQVQLEAFRSWGIEPHPLAWSETFNGLQQGVIDGQENPHTVNRDQKFWEVQKYITDVHYLLWVGPMLFSETWYQKLDPKTKELVEKASREATEYEWEWSAKQENLALEECLKHNMVINKLEDEDQWKAAARGVWPKFYDKVGGKELIDKALAIMSQ